MGNLTDRQVQALNDLPKFIPSLSRAHAGDDTSPLNLGTRLKELEDAAPDGLIDALADAAVAVSSAAATNGVNTITAISATATSAVATTDASAPGVGYVQAEAASAATLANALKVQLNINATENADLRARQAQDKTAIDALTATCAALITLTSELKTKFNALQAAIDDAAA